MQQRAQNKNCIAKFANQHMAYGKEYNSNMFKKRKQEETHKINSKRMKCHMNKIYKKSKLSTQLAKARINKKKNKNNENH